VGRDMKRISEVNHAIKWDEKI
jgi:hypothetical protein